MKRTLPRLLGVIVIAVLSNTAVKATAIQKTLHAATSASPIVIAVLSDHYTDEAEFDNDAANFITYGLLAHPYYAARAADLQIDTFYEPLKAGLQSNYEFNVEVLGDRCDMSWSPATAQKVSDVVFTANPDHTIVIGDHPYSLGCTEGEWSYVGVDAAGSDVLPHELGHGLGKLMDEWVMEANSTVSHPGIPLQNTRNCYDTRHGATPPWTLPGSGSIPGCDLHGLNVVHAYAHMSNGHQYCLMGAMDDGEFCPVCAKYMDDAFYYKANPIGDPEPGDGTAPQRPTNLRIIPSFLRPPPPTGARIIRALFVQPVPGVAPKPVPPRSILRLLVSFDPATGAITAKKGYPIRGRYSPNYRRLGEYVYEISDLNRIVDVGVLPSNLFTSHSYQGGARHQTSAPHATDVSIQLPDVTMDLLKDPTHAMMIRIYWLPPTVTEQLITPAVFAKLKQNKQAEPRGELSPTQIRNATY